MKIKLSLAVAHKILACGAATRLEFSGLGFCTRESDGNIFVYDFVLMNVGSEGYTEIDPKRILPLIERDDKENMRVWIHRHPITSWSARDLQTILKEPLGSTPERVGWSVSIVLTPVGWIGRIDNYIKGITKDLEIEPSVVEVYEEIRELQTAHDRFRREPTRDGSRVLEEDQQDDDPDEFDDEYEYEDEEDPSWDLSKETSRQITTVVLTRLALEENDPASTSFAEVLEDHGIDWQTIREEAGKR